MIKQWRLLLLVLCLAVNFSALALAEEPGTSGEVQVGRYRYIPTGDTLGYLFDTATGRLWRLYIGKAELIWEGVDGLNLMGRFELVPRHACNCSELGIAIPRSPIWHLVDTATGRVWQITGTDLYPLGDPSWYQ